MEERMKGFGGGHESVKIRRTRVHPRSKLPVESLIGTLMYADLTALHGS